MAPRRADARRRRGDRTVPGRSAGGQEAGNGSAGKITTNMRALGVELPGLTKIDEIYEEAVKDGHADLDYAATMMLLEEKAGLRVKGK